MLMNRVKQVKALPDYRLDIVFRNGERGVFDCTPYRGYDCLAGIWDDGVFDKVVAVKKTAALKVGKPYVKDAAVKGTVVKNGKGKKITVFTYKPKKSSSRKMGHRQPYTKVQINEIG